MTICIYAIIAIVLLLLTMFGYAIFAAAARADRALEREAARQKERNL